MSCNKNAVEIFNEMVKIGDYYSSGRPVVTPTEKIVADIISKIPLNKNDTILDVGCGTGFLTIALSKLCKKIVACDAGEEVIARAKQKASDENINNIEYHISWATKLPASDESVDHVIMYAVIHYLENEDQLKECISELLRTCKKGGKILIADIPETELQKELSEREKTEDEQELIDKFSNEREEYDRLYSEYVKTQARPQDYEVKSSTIVDIAKSLGHEAQVVEQLRELTFSLTRRDVLITKK